ncbi:hypothetical protein EV127DRAFT_431878 [Xylaria flabelliformis]|nr:hypothetical protein EV127DRAFT_431878 [Xylaria flabelliformis]
MRAAALACMAIQPVGYLVSAAQIPNTVCTSHFCWRTAQKPSHTVSRNSRVALKFYARHDLRIACRDFGSLFSLSLC